MANLDLVTLGLQMSGYPSNCKLSNFGVSLTVKTKQTKKYDVKTYNISNCCRTRCKQLFNNIKYEKNEYGYNWSFRKNSINKCYCS